MTRVCMMKHKGCKVPCHYVGRFPHLNLVPMCDGNVLSVGTEADIPSGCFEVDVAQCYSCSCIDQDGSPIDVDDEDELALFGVLTNPNDWFPHLKGKRSAVIRREVEDAQTIAAW